MHRVYYVCAASGTLAVAWAFLFNKFLTLKCHGELIEPFADITTRLSLRQA
jgi:hypothetical protein